MSCKYCGYTEFNPACGACVGDRPMKEGDPYDIPQHDAGAKLDADKPDSSLLLMYGKALQEVARLGTFGARKYSRGGWQYVTDGENRYTAALLRHLFAEHYEAMDSDSGVLHATAVAWNALARLELMLREEDDAEDGPTARTERS